MLMLNFLLIKKKLKYSFKIKISNMLFIWGLGIGDWGLGIGDWAQSPIPNPQSPIPIRKILFELKNFYKMIRIEKFFENNSK